MRGGALVAVGVAGLVQAADIRLRLGDDAPQDGPVLHHPDQLPAQQVPGYGEGVAVVKILGENVHAGLLVSVPRL